MSKKLEYIHKITGTQSYLNNILPFYDEKRLQEEIFKDLLQWSEFKEQNLLLDGVQKVT